MAAAPAPSLSSILNLARRYLAVGRLEDAQRLAGAVLDARAPPSVRGGALLVAADAAYDRRSYAEAAGRYADFVSEHGDAPQAGRAALALGWAHLRNHDGERARQAWTEAARKFPTDPIAPLSLVLAAQAAVDAGQASAAREILDHALAEYPTGPDAPVARLNRAIAALSEDREPDAVSDLRALLRSGRSSVIGERLRLIRAVALPGAEAGLEDRRPVGPDAGRGDDDGPGAGALGPRQFAEFLDGTRDPDGSVRILHGLVLVAVQDRAWPDVPVLVSRLVVSFPSYPAIPGLLARVAEAATADEQWALVRATDEELVARYPDRPLGGEAAVDFAEALFRTGAVAEAGSWLDRLVASAGGETSTPRALGLLAEVDETLGDRPAALAAHERLRRDHPAAERSAASLLSHARLLLEVGRRSEARPLLERVVARAEGQTLGEAAYWLAEILSGDGQHAAAGAAYMEAATAAEGSPWEPLALLGAGQALAAQHQVPQALEIYRKVLWSALVPPPRAGAPGQPAGTPDGAATREAASEAAYRIAHILRGRGQTEEALDLYLTAADLAPDSPPGRRALVGAVQCLVGARDLAAAEATYRRLLESSPAEPEMLEQARRALRRAGGAADPPDDDDASGARPR